HGQQVSQTHMDEIKRVLESGKQPRRSLLRFVFPDAYRGISRAATRLRVQRWSRAAVERYFLKDHDEHLNAAIANGIPRQIVDHCRVFLGRVVSLEPLECCPL